MLPSWHERHSNDTLPGCVMMGMDWAALGPVVGAPGPFSYIS